MKKLLLGIIICFSMTGLSAQIQVSDSSYIFLDSIWVEMPEVFVKGERPIVKVEEGRLTYDVPRLIENKSVTNAFETLQELPGVIVDGESVSLPGSSSLTILLNGQVTTMSYEQLVYLLKTVPASRVERAEVMYSAPPQYNVRGSLINIVLKQQDEEKNTFQGEVGATYSQAHYGDVMGRVNLLYSTPQFMVDFLYAPGYGKKRSGEDMFARHALEDNVYEIEQYNRGDATYNHHNLRLGTTYNFRNKDRINFSYTGQFRHSENGRISNTDFYLEGMKELLEQVHTDSQVDGPAELHNVKVEYNSHFGLVAGGDYTYYNDETTQNLLNRYKVEDVKIRSLSEQRIHKGLFFINQTHSFSNQWTLNYGTNLSFSRSNSYADNWLNDNLDEITSFKGVQEEFTGNFFVGFTKSFTDNFSVQASLAMEKYKTTETSEGNKNELWNELAWFPNANINYVIDPYHNHILQLSFSSDKTYPGYWAINPSVYYLNSYSEVHGNPQLKPSRYYNVQLNYIIKQKYVVVGFFSRTQDRFVQLPWQSNESLKNIFKVVNLDYSQNWGMSFVIPFKWGEFLDSRLTLSGLQMHEKASSFYDLSFDRKKLFGMIRLNNTLNLSTEPNLKMDVSGHYTTPAIQGVYDLGNTYNLSLSFKWTFAKEKTQLILKGQDLLSSTIPKTTVNFANQYSRMDVLNDNRSVSLSFIYKFGGFKEGKKDEVDTSRFGR